VLQSAINFELAKVVVLTKIKKLEFPMILVKLLVHQLSFLTPSAIISLTSKWKTLTASVIVSAVEKYSGL
jgi:hypothetical protein